MVPFREQLAICGGIGAAAAATVPKALLLGRIVPLPWAVAVSFCGPALVIASALLSVAQTASKGRSALPPAHWWP